MSRAAAHAAFDDNWKCSWFPECNAPCQRPCRNRGHTRGKCAAHGLHELEDCVHGKWGFYYSPEGLIKTWGGIHQYNPNGCAKIYLLVYNRDKRQFLFDLSKKGEYNLPSHRRITCDPEDLHEVATRFLATLLPAGNQNLPPPIIPRRFIFIDAAVIYPVCLNNEHASQILFRAGRKWFGQEEVESAMKFVTLEWVLKKDNQSYGYDVTDNRARLGLRFVFPLASFVLRWLTEKKYITATATPSSASVSSLSTSSSISVSNSNSTSAYASASASPSICASSVFSEPDIHVSVEEFLGL